MIYIKLFFFGLVYMEKCSCFYNSLTLIIILARNVKPKEIAPKVKLTFHPRPLIFGCHIGFSEITGLFELKFHMESNTIQ